MYTILDALQQHAAKDPEGIAYTFLTDGESQEISHTYGRLSELVQHIASAIEGRCSAQERALLIFQPGLDFIVAFLSCMWAEVIAVPVNPLAAAAASPSGHSRMIEIALDCQPKVILTTRSVFSGIEAQLASASLTTAVVIFIDELQSTPHGSVRRSLPSNRNGIAFLQYTSGSTGNPKGVIVTHSNILQNEEMIKQACRHDHTSIFVGWLPYYHDMGLIGNILQPLYLGSRSVLMSPTAFLQRPSRWLRAISRYHAVTSGGPNFAYDLCADTLSAEDKARLDLSSWAVAFNGAEPIRKSTIEKFCRAFADCGFRRDSFYPCYGLAEATLMVSGASRGLGPAISTVDEKSLAKHRIFLSHNAAPQAKTLVSSGRQLPHAEIVVVKIGKSIKADAQEVGELWVHGPAVALGYWNKPEETAAVFHATLDFEEPRHFLRTGDLGFILDDNLYVTGRLKDVIIIRGANYYPQDIEWTAEEAHPALRRGCIAAVSLETDDQEALGIICEVERSCRPEGFPEIAGLVSQRVMSTHRVNPHVVALVARGQVPKTTSGKLRRSECRNRFLSGKLKLLYRYESAVLITQSSHKSSCMGQPQLAARNSEIASALDGFVASLLPYKKKVDYRQSPLRNLGLDSLREVELNNYLSIHCGVTPPEGVSLDQMSLDEIIRELSDPEHLWHSYSPPPPSMLQPDKKGLSCGQHALWLHCRAWPQSNAYKICRVVAMPSSVNADRLSAALSILYHRYPILQCIFEHTDGGALRSQKPNSSFCTVINVEGYSQEETLRLMHDESAASLSLETGPLFRVLVLTKTLETTMIISVHHLIADLWSLALLLDEAANIYTSLSGGAAEMPAPPRHDYDSFVSWQQAFMSSEEAGLHRDYWSQLLNEGSAAAAPFKNRPAANGQGERGKHFDFEIGKPVTENLRDICIGAGTTLFCGILAVFQLVVYKHTRERAFLIGVPFLGRTKPEWARTIGYFANLLPLRAEIFPNMTFRDLLAQVSSAVTDAKRHQDYPFSSIVEHNRSAFSVNPQSTLQVVFAYHDVPFSSLGPLRPLILGQRGDEAATTLEMRSLPTSIHGPQFELALHMTEHHSILRGQFQWDQEHIDAQEVYSLVEHVKSLAALISQHNIDDPIARLNLLTKPEVASLSRWNNTYSPIRSPESIVSQVEAYVQRYPDAIAVSDDRERISYRELNRRADVIASHLTRVGIGQESIVAICLDRSTHLSALLLGIWKTSAAYLPLDPGSPAERIRQMCLEARPSLLIAEAQYVGRLPQTCRQWVFDESIYCNPPSALMPKRSYSDKQAAYVLFTSGSTGRPKGVVNTQGGIANRLRWMAEHYGIGQGDRILQKTPYTFDVSVWELFLPLLCGSELVMASPSSHIDVEYLYSVMKEREITTVHFVPSQLSLMLDLQQTPPHSLRRVICSGEALSANLQRRFFRSWNSSGLYNLYGPTEAAIDVTEWRCEPEQSTVPIGRPISNTSIHILNRDLSPMPIGCAGELYIAGVGLSRGYLGQPDVTAAAFLPNPQSTIPGARMYKSGDIAFWRRDGLLEFVGRTDRQVKLRGVRIELEEVEGVLRAHANVQDVAVLMNARGSHETGLTAYLVPYGALPSSSQLRDYLTNALPLSMIPAEFIEVPQLPRTSNGKVDYLALQNRTAAAIQEKPPADLPDGFLETELATIWRRVLGRPSIGRNETFFELGGHSLLVTQLSSRVNKHFNIVIPIRKYFESATTISTLAAEVERMLLREVGNARALALSAEVKRQSHI